MKIAFFGYAQIGGQEGGIKTRFLLDSAKSKNYFCS